MSSVMLRAIDVMQSANDVVGNGISAGAYRGAAVLLVTEDLDELFELADRMAIIFESKIVYETTLASADRSYRSSPGRSCRQALKFVRPCLKI